MSKIHICPKCNKDTLENFNTAEGVVVDFCTSCKGVWFDKNELAQYIEISKDIPELDEMKEAAKDTDLICPKCNGFLEELPFSSKSKLMIDRCQECGGIFFDAGELMAAENVSAKLESLSDRVKFVVDSFAKDGYKLL